MAMGFVERMAYAIGKGVAAAWFEEMRKPRTAEAEKQTEEDVTDEDNLRANLDGLRIDGLPTDPHGDSGPVETPPPLA